MDYTIIYDKNNPKKEWMYVADTNRGCSVCYSIEKHYEELCMPGYRSISFHDLESYIHYVEKLHHMLSGQLSYTTQPDLPYEFW